LFCSRHYPPGFAVLFKQLNAPTIQTTPGVCVRDTHPCKERKDGAPSVVVASAGRKGSRQQRDFSFCFVPVITHQASRYSSNNLMGQPSKLLPAYACVIPTLAKNARMGHPQSWWRHQGGGGGPPAFCAEAAVLIAIFPYLDFVLENQHIKGTSQLVGGSSPIDMEPVKRVSAILCIGCLVSAVVLAIKAPSEANNQDDEE
jgi:hypothetical protein